MFEHLSKEPAFASFSPVANVAVSALNAVDGNAGSYNESILEQLIPNETLLRGVQLYEATKLNGGGGEEGFNSSILQTYNMLMYMQNEATDKWEKGGEKGPAPQIVPTQQEALSNPHAMQVFTQKVKNYVTTLYIMRAVLGFASPISAEVEPQNFGFSNKLQEAITKAGSVNAGFTKFLTEYPNATPYTVAESFTPNGQGQTSGLSLSSSRSRLSSGSPRTKTLARRPPGRPVADAPTQRRQVLGHGLQRADRRRPAAQRTPQQHLGPALHRRWQLDLLQEPRRVREVPGCGVGNNSTAKNDLYNSWDSFVTKLGKQYPIWYVQDFKSPDNRYLNAAQTVQDLQTIFKNNQAPGRVADRGCPRPAQRVQRRRH